MGVAREFGPWALNAREFRRAGLNPRVWLARRVNQSATDAVGEAVIFSVNVADPSPLDAAALSPGGADPLSSTDPLFSLSRGPLRRRGPPLFTAAVLSHHSAVSRRGPPLFHGPPLPTAPRAPPHHSAVSRRGPPLFTAAVPSHHSVVRAVRTPSLPRTLSLLPRPPPYNSVVRAARTPPLFHGPPLPTAPRAPPHHSAVRRRGPPLSTAAAPSPPFRRPGGADPLWPSPRTPGARILLRKSRGCASGWGVGKTRLKMVPEAKFFCHSSLGAVG
ncbi:hypothetical protein niasHT_017985 [Heterodera trifolii]|uniref:Uncharacterized protein n=1 Tax=Heterodera trifolii TaxID=157864 RepID=A0ABD2KXM6_9BILA